MKKKKLLYHLSKDNRDSKTLEPRIPKSHFIDIGYEDGVTPRVCFAQSIEGALKALGDRVLNTELFVHVADGNYDFYKPTKKQVPDCKITGEVWVKEKVKLKLIGKIKTGDWIRDDWHIIKCDKKYNFNGIEYKWIEKLNEFGIFTGINFQ